MTATAESFSFQAEVRQILDLMIHSVYSNKDIFLRELVSNASDALDKRRFAAVKHPEMLPADTALHILVTPDKAARTLSIADTGIGMNREEVIDLIGTIAKSGTREFAKRLREAKDHAVDARLIGQFGVGFYSVFMVADRVTLLTRRADAETAVRWESTGDGTYTIEETAKDEPGTTITLHLKAGEKEDGFDDYLEPWRIRQIVKQYSDFVAYPIELDAPQEDDGTEEAASAGRETLNTMKAIWLRDKASVSEEEYGEFYKHVAHDWQEPMLRIQARIEGTLEYALLLFVPARPPMDLFWHPSQRRGGVQLYVQRVFIMDDCRGLVPEYLRFLRGVVDSEDLSLNLSREMLHQDRQVQRIGKGLVAKVLAALADLRGKDREKYLGFWNHFGAVLKEGLVQDADQREAVLDLMLAPSTADPEKLVSMAEYLDRMKPDQEAIYFLCADSRAKAEASPHLEAFRERGYEVLLLSDPVDEIWTASHPEYKGKRLVSAGKGEVDLGSDEERKQAGEARKEKEKEYGALLAALQEPLDEWIKEVRLSSRLTESAACLVSGEADLSPQLEQLMRAMGQDVPAHKRILEINPNHPLLARLHARFEAGRDDPALRESAELLFGQAVLAEGGHLPDPARFSRLVADLLVKTL